ncbi:hypothetical protein SD074_16800 [Prolixibacter sp. SD074]|nr:hypothetical protein SD074_16800 [Prolixibacter sp. SD074]
MQMFQMPIIRCFTALPGEYDRVVVLNDIVVAQNCSIGAVKGPVHGMNKCDDGVSNPVYAVKDLFNAVL